jgi:uncharacterized phiE125 gp8 family phage protein
MALKIVTAPYADPVSLEAAKQHIRVDTPDDDALIARTIRSAVETFEVHTRRQYVTASWRMTLDAFPSDGYIDLPMPPVQSVTSITYVDADGATQTVSAADYSLDSDREPGRINLAYNASWPSPRTQPNAVTVSFKSGYATPFTAVAATDLLTAKGRTFTNGDIVRVTNSGGALPTPLTEVTDYYVVGVSGSTLQLSLTLAGAAINLTDAGVGTHFIGEIPSSAVSAILVLTAGLYEYRESVITSGAVPAEIKQVYESLVWANRWGSYP